MIKFKLQFILFIIGFGLIIPYFANATDLFFNSSYEQFGKGDLFEIQFLIDTEDEIINAIECSIIYPANLLRLVKINKANSIISMWIQPPEKVEDGKINLSGVIPGGFNGVFSPLGQEKKTGEIVSFVFEAKEMGNDLISIQDIKILLNDGFGTEAFVSTNSYFFKILNYIGDKKITIKEDMSSPEKFKLEIAQDKLIFDGKYFLVFSTQDKGSGISYYRVKEGENDFVVAESPYLLKDQNRNSDITVQAIDEAGNVREERLRAINKKQSFFYNNSWLFSVLIITIIIIWVNKNRKRK